MRSCTSRPTGLSASAETSAVSRPKHRFSPGATLYSPPPSHTLKERDVWMRDSPGSSRSMTSPSATRSQRRPDFSGTVNDIELHLEPERPRGRRDRAKYVATRFL